jgi:hypothetical protein
MTALNMTPLLFAIAKDHSLAVVAQNSKPSRDRQGADAQLSVAFCFACGSF